MSPLTSRRLSGGFLLGAAAALASACSNGDWPRFDGRREQTDVNVVYDPSIDFSRYLTFALRNEAGDEPAALDELDPATRRDVEFANALVARELRDIGLIEVSAAEADLLAFSLGRTSSATGVRWRCMGGVWGGYWYWGYVYYDPCAWVEADYVEVDRTTLVVGLLDPELSEVAFAGFARGIGDGLGSRRQKIVDAVANIFERYPARPAALDVADAGAPEVDAGRPERDGGAPDGAADAGADAAFTSP